MKGSTNLKTKFVTNDEKLNHIFSDIFQCCIYWWQFQNWQKLKQIFQIDANPPATEFSWLFNVSQLINSHHYNYTSFLFHLLTASLPQYHCSNNQLPCHHYWLENNIIISTYSPHQLSLLFFFWRSRRKLFSDLKLTSLFSINTLQSITAFQYT